MRSRDKRTATENVITPPRTSQGLEAARCRIDLLIGYKISIPFKMLTRLCLTVRHAEQDGCLVFTSPNKKAKNVEKRILTIKFSID